MSLPDSTETNAHGPSIANAVGTTVGWLSLGLGAISFAILFAKGWNLGVAAVWSDIVFQYDAWMIAIGHFLKPMAEGALLILRSLLGVEWALPEGWFHYAAAFNAFALAFASMFAAASRTRFVTPLVIPYLGALGFAAYSAVGLDGWLRYTAITFSAMLIAGVLFWWWDRSMAVPLLRVPLAVAVLLVTNAGLQAVVG